MTCQHCGAETTNGLELCATCQYGASMWLTYVPIYFRNLARQQRPGRPNGSLGTNGQWLIQQGETEGSEVQAALGKAASILNKHADRLAESRSTGVPTGDTEAETISLICEFFGDHLAHIATLPWAGRFLRDLSGQERALRALTEAAVPGWYAGACQQAVDGAPYVCAAPLYVIPGLTWVTCPDCGATTAASEHLETILEEASDWFAPPMQLAVVIVSLLDGETSVPRLHKRIAKWGERGDIKEAPRHTRREHIFDVHLERIVLAEVPVGRARYRLGDVLDELHRRYATRAQTVA